MVSVTPIPSFQSSPEQLFLDKISPEAAERSAEKDHQPRDYRGWRVTEGVNGALAGRRSDRDFKNQVTI